MRGGGVCEVVVYARWWCMRGGGVCKVYVRCMQGVCVHACVHAFMRACVCPCMRVCMCVCVCIRMQKNIRITSKELEYHFKPCLPGVD